jgi:hypothetical protein
VKRSTKVLALICVGTFLTAFDVTIVNVAYRSIGIAVVEAILVGVGGTSGYRWGLRFTAAAMLVAAVAMGMLFRPPTAAELAASVLDQRRPSAV